MLVLVAGVVGWQALQDPPSDPIARTGPTSSTASTTSVPALPSTTRSATTAPPSSPPACDPAGMVASWPTEQQVAQLLMVGVDPDTPDEVRSVVANHGVGGVFVGGNPTTLFETGTLRDLPSLGPVPPLVAVDDEGGRVTRIDALAGPLPSAREMAQSMSPAEVRSLAAERGAALRELGVTMDLAPVVDVADQPADEVIGDRSFGDDPDQVIAYAGAFAAGLIDAGVIPVLKHFPGHGRATGDSHVEAVSTPPLDDLRQSDLLPYQALATGPAGVMVGHLDVPGLTSPGQPTSVSPAAINGLLRTDLGFGGLVMTDDLGSMAAIADRYTLVEAVEAALAAGADMALWVTSAELPVVIDHLVGAVESGQLDRAQVTRSVLRVLGVKGVDPCRGPIANG